METLSDRQRNVLFWLRRHAIPLTTVQAGSGLADLQALKPVIGDARIVALGEATHGTRECFQVKHRLLEFLVTGMGFTTFPIEANWPESLMVNDYVLHGRGDPASVLSGLLHHSAVLDPLPELTAELCDTRAPGLLLDRDVLSPGSHRRDVKFEFVSRERQGAWKLYNLQIVKGRTHCLIAPALRWRKSTLLHRSGELVCFAQSRTRTLGHTMRSWTQSLHPDADEISQLLSANEHSTAVTLNELRRIYSKPTPGDLNEDSSDRRDRQHWYGSCERTAEAQCRHSPAYS